jgi:hypothetical protein
VFCFAESIFSCACNCTLKDIKHKMPNKKLKFFNRLKLEIDEGSDLIIFDLKDELK